jgi:hypothetical protein
MRALVAARELGTLDRRFGLDGQVRHRAARAARRSLADGETNPEPDAAADLGAQLEMFAERIALSGENATDELTAELDRLRAEIERIKRAE